MYLLSDKANNLWTRQSPRGERSRTPARLWLRLRSASEICCSVACAEHVRGGSATEILLLRDLTERPVAVEGRYQLKEAAESDRF